MNKYTFKVQFYNRQWFWLAPIPAYTYAQALEQVYSNRRVMAATLQEIVTPTGARVNCGVPVIAARYDLDPNARYTWA